VLDANVLVANFRPGNAFKLVLEGARTGQLRLVVPELAVKEAARKHTAFVQDKIVALEKAAAGLDRAGVAISVGSLPDPSAASVAYEARLRRLLSEAKATVAPLPSTPHERLVEKALEKSKPFTGRDAGYRDALLWETALAEAKRTDGPVVLLTMNTRDFADSKDAPQLAADLQRDLLAAQLAADAVELVVDVKVVVDRYVDAEVVAIDEVENNLHLVQLDLAGLIDAHLYDYDFERDDLENLSVDRLDLDSDFEVDHIEVLDAHVVGVFNVSHVSVEEVTALSTEELVAGLHLELDADLDVEVETEGYDPRDEVIRHASRTRTTTRTLAVSVEAGFDRAAGQFVDVLVRRVRVI
jgi:hypothetical protein